VFLLPEPFSSSCGFLDGVSFVASFDRVDGPTAEGIGTTGVADFGSSVAVVLKASTEAEAGFDVTLGLEVTGALTC
jgi:hypothetical protein